jgi:hypothetical protein
MQLKSGTGVLRPPESCGQTILLRQEFNIEIVGQEESRETAGSVKLRAAEKPDKDIPGGGICNVDWKVGTGSEAEVNQGAKTDPFGFRNRPAGADPRWSR